ncbi:MAG: PLP-dependent aminotransferase family protein [Provencibacterium sp.]|jgi:2-aminoadipate transaminase|nr:PLP-dependent aminotransferase family protein [Provencibacterium sp.]
MNYNFSSKIDGVKPSAIREILKMSSDPSVISLAAGNPAPDAFPVKAVEEITAGILREEPILALQYSVTEGYPALRDTLRAFARNRYNVMGEEDDLIVVSGAQQGIDLSCKCLCNEGDTVLCEDPSFVGSLNAFRSYNVNLVGIPVEEDGISIEALEKALREEKNVKMLYVIPNFQNPSGVTMSWEKRKRVYELCCKHGVMILEDNPYGDLRFEGEDIPAIKTLDEEGRVIYCGTFSKILSPGLRVGFAIANRAVLQKLVVAKQCADVHTAILSQLICLRFMNEYDVEAHIGRLCALYRQKSALMLGEMEKHFSDKVRFIRPQGGLFIWCTLPEGSDMVEFCRRATYDYKVAVVPGTAFTAHEEDPTTSFRLNFSTPTDANIVKGIEILGRLTKEFIR